MHSRSGPPLIGSADAPGAIAPIATGVQGGRKVVVPVPLMPRPVSSAMIAMPGTLAVLPWSVAMPSVV